MSSYKALATVTAAVRQLLLAPVQNAVVGATITVVRPDASSADTAAQLPNPGVNIFLMQTTPNAALRNVDLPTRRRDGTIIKRPAAAVDLHYIFTFYGDDTQFQTQLLLGAVVTTLHANPSLTPAVISSAIGGVPVLSDSDLANAVNLVTFTPTGLSLEEFSKLWSVMLQIPYVLATIYQAGPVLLVDEAEIASAPLPVRRKPIVRALATGAPVQPRIARVLAQETSPLGAPAEAPILLGYTLVLEGSFVQDALTSIEIDGNLVATAVSGGNSLSLVLSAGLKLSAGPHTVRVIQTLPSATPARTLVPVPSNVKSFVLQPTIVSIAAQTTASPPSETVLVSLSPPVAQNQRVRLLLAPIVTSPPSSEPTTYAVDAPPAATGGQDPFPIAVTGVPRGAYLARVEVDDAESLLDFGTGGYSGPTVTL